MFIPGSGLFGLFMVPCRLGDGKWRKMQTREDDVEEDEDAEQDIESGAESTSLKGRGGSGEKGGGRGGVGGETAAVAQLLKLMQREFGWTKHNKQSVGKKLGKFVNR